MRRGRGRGLGRWVAVAALACGVGVGCGDGGVARVPPGDAGVGDAVDPDDDGAAKLTFCSDSAVAGTCAQAFFQRVGDCFHPYGACTLAQTGSTMGTLCWGSGAKLTITVDDAAMVTHQRWTAGGGALCLAGDVEKVAGATQFRLVAGGRTLVYNEGTGEVQCPDGTRDNIGAAESGCKALRDILAPPKCAKGSCP